MSMKKGRTNAPINKGDLIKYGIKAKDLFPRSKIKKGGELSPYQRRRARLAIVSKKRIDATVLEPDRPDFYAAAGFMVADGLVYPSSQRITIKKLYYAEGLSEFYTAHFRGAVMNVQLIPITALAEYLRALAEMEGDYSRFYDRITLREGDRNAWGGELPFERMQDSAESLLMYLERYIRHGELSGNAEAGTYEYIQVCFISFLN